MHESLSTSLSLYSIIVASSATLDEEEMLGGVDYAAELRGT